MASSPTDSNTTSNEAQYTQDERKNSPPAFLDLADSAARLGTNMPDMSARVELKRMEKRLEHQRQRAIQRQLFEEQMRALEQQQAAELLSIPLDPNDPNSAGGIHVALSAPTTPPREPSVVNGFHPSATPPARDLYGMQEHHANALTTAMSKADKRKSVTYAPSPSALPPSESGLVAAPGTLGPIGRTAGAKSMPASRRASASAETLEADDLAGTLQSLALMDAPTVQKQSQPQSILKTKGRYSEEAGVIGDSHTYTGHGLNAGLMLDQQLDQEMHNAMRNLPTSDDDKYHKLSASSVALDLAPLSQTPRNTFMQRGLHDSIGKSSEWPQFSGPLRGPDIVVTGQRPDQRRNVTNPSGHLTAALGPAFNNDSPSGKLGSTVSASATPNLAQHHTPNDSRRSSPPGMSDTLSTMSNITAARSVPATPLGLVPGRQDIPNIAKTPGTPGASATPGAGSGGYVQQHTPGGQLGGGALNDTQGGVSATDLSATLSRLGNGQYDGTLSFGSIQGGMDDSLQYGNGADLYGMNNSLNSGLSDGSRYGTTYGGFDNNNDRMNPTQGGAGAGSTALYHHHGSRYGLGLGGRMVGPDSKMNGLHGPKHKRGDMDREFNRFAGTRLEELQGEIPQLCKDQHGCRYLQKKLEEGVPEHRDMIFRETYGHFADLMTDPFGNYLCQKLLEYSTDEQRNAICESVASDLVTISLNMHGTRAVQKMIDFLSTQRQADLRYNAQIHAIIVALSLHVVTLIKDLNGNHVIQKCLNKLAPEDNQFIYNAVAANCVEVATHRHGCCVLQRCIDHASDQQRIQLVQEITYNALTLVQDPYGNYVVQYILDLNDNRFSDGVIRQFTGNVCALSVQKFSSNVIEKCVRVAEHNTRKMLIDELLNRTRLEKLLRDSYGNYCVQTALDYAEPAQRMALVEGIRPILPLIRNTPYGKRIQSKLQREQMDAANSGHYGGGYTAQGIPNIGMGSLGAAHGHGHGHGPQARHLHGGQSMHHPTQLGDMYNQSSLYSLQNGAGLTSHSHSQPGLGQTQMHSQQLHAGLQHHSPIEGYVLQNNSHAAIGANHGSAAFNTAGGFSNPLGGISTFGSTVGLGNGITDPYHQQRAASFPYGM